MSLGQEYAGSIDKIGESVTNFKIGDKVFAAGEMPRLGGHAEYVVTPAAPTGGMLALRPGNLSASEAAAIPFAAFEAYYLLKRTRVQSGDRVLIVGAGGSIGTYAVQIAKAWGAEVTTIDRETKHTMLREIGADKIIDARDKNWRRAAFDVVLDVVGKHTFSRGLRALHRGGRYVSANPRFALLFRALWARISSGKRVMVGTADHSVETIASVTDLIESGEVKPVIGRSFTLDEIVEAHRYAESGEKVGNIVVIVDPAATQAR